MKLSHAFCAGRGYFHACSLGRGYFAWQMGLKDVLAW